MIQFRGRRTGRIDDFTASAEGKENWSAVSFETNEPNVVISRGHLSDLHAPLIDLDFPVHLEPSSTPDHFHLYIERWMLFAEYLRLLEVMAEIGLVQKGYYEATKARGYGTLRLPWVFKEDMPIEEQTRRLLS